jgi:ABC-type nitrate/sulfonate/bicarbonate transport system substrate-binding protein
LLVQHISVVTKIAGTAVALVLGASVGAGSVRAQTHLDMIGFGGASNLPIWVAQDRGLFAKQGLDIKLDATQGSIAQMQNLMAGKYQVASTSIDNVIAYSEGQGDVKIDNFDMVCVAGVHSGLNSVVTRPEIKSYAQIRGKPVAVDAVGTGYAFVLYRVLQQHGLKFKQDYSIAAVGGGPQRLEALKDNKAVAAVMSAPNDTEAKNLGYNILADAAAALGGYQGSAYCLRDSWAKTHKFETVAWIRALIAAHDYVFANKAGSIEVLKSHIKNLSDADARVIYTSLTGGKGGLNRKAAISMKGMKTVLSLRSEYAEPHKMLTNPQKYVDLSYWKLARKSPSSAAKAKPAAAMAPGMKM